LTATGEKDRISPVNGKKPGPRIAFITPSPATLKHDWYKDLIWQKVGIPNLAGYLKRAGFPDIVQYDFTDQVRAAYAVSPGSVRLMLYDDGEAVADFLRGGTSPRARRVRGQTAFFLDALGVAEKDLFGISLAHFLGDDREIALGARLARCLAKLLKERYPRCAVMLGGMQNMSADFQRRDYEVLLRETPWLDYAVCGEAHEAVLAVCRAVRDARPFRAPRHVRARRVGAGLLLETSRGKGLARYFVPEPPGGPVDLSVPYGFPAYDKANSASFSYTGRRIREFYHLPASLAPLEKKFKPDNYLTLQVSFSEGCDFGCLFCSNAGSGVFSLGLDESIRILKLFRDEYGCRHFLFYDPNFNPSRKYAREFLAKIIKARLDIRWADCFNLRVMDEELVAMMREAGVVKVVAGAEYPTPRMLKYINKGVTVDRLNRNLELLHKAGIWNHVLLITGMPTENDEDLRQLESWLRDTKDLINAYTVGSFHMADQSPFQRDPEKFGFRIKDAIKLYCQTGFDEKGGLEWREKAEQNARNNRRVREFIDDLKGSRKPTGTRMDDSHLLMYLYRTLGHGRKALIERLYEAACTVNPHIAPAYKALAGQARDPLSPLNRALRGAGAALELSPPGPEELSFALVSRGARLPCSLRARSEDVTIGPAAGLRHGDLFVLRTGEEGRGGGPPALRKALPALLKAAESWSGTGPPAK
jgi:radical SAM superfamily enzyme YgiQ (UPF0313 family)